MNVTEKTDEVEEQTLKVDKKLDENQNRRSASSKTSDAVVSSSGWYFHSLYVFVINEFLKKFTVIISRSYMLFLYKFV